MASSGCFTPKWYFTVDVILSKEREKECHPIIVPQAVIRQVAKEKHREIYWAAEAIRDDLKHQVNSVEIPEIKSVVIKCKKCLQNTPLPCERPPLRTTKTGNCTGIYRQIGFSELPRQEGYFPEFHWVGRDLQDHRVQPILILLVLADTFSGWPEVFPCSTNKAREVTKIFLK